MNVCETWWIGDDCIGDEWYVQLVSWIIGQVGDVPVSDRTVVHPLFSGIISRLGSSTISGLDTTPPTAFDHGCNLLATLAYIARSKCVKSRHETRILHHEGHELGRITTDAEEFQTIFEDKVLENRVGGEPDSVAVGPLKDFPEGDERLNITTRTDDMNDDVQSGWR